ncbi:MAG: hypothetical protein ACTS42_01595 [Candidatus Hodgkinia cicadicola]
MTVHCNGGRFHNFRKPFRRLSPLLRLVPSAEPFEIGRRRWRGEDIRPLSAGGEAESERKLLWKLVTRRENVL